ncbi:MAG: hypothetical protein V9H69_27340 [Anaerolineae bacterium]
MGSAAEELDPDDLERLAEAIRQFSGRLRDLLQRLLNGEPLTGEELDQLGELVGLRHADHPALAPWMSQRMLRALGMPQVQNALHDLWQILNQLGMSRQRLEQLQQLVQGNMDALQEQVQRHVGATVARRMAEQGRS